jgi:lipopolysaccharide biosynthesis glycosyltransferase
MMQAPRGTIRVASSVDENFLPLIGPVAMSMAYHASPDRPIEYRVFYAGRRNADVVALDGFTVGPVTVRLVRPPDDFSRFEGRSRMGTATLVRLSAGELMQDIDRVIFLDADVLIQADIGGLFDIDLRTNAIGAVVDFLTYDMLAKQRTGPPPIPIFDIDDLLRNKIGLTATTWYQYVNTGVVLMDLAALRAEGFGVRAVALLEQMVDQLAWPDQDIINIVLRDRIQLLDPHWNVLLTALLRPRLAADVPDLASDILVQRRHQSIMHYAADAKPWLRTAHLPSFGRWWYFANNSPTAAAIRAVHTQIRRKRSRLPHPVTGLATLGAKLRYDFVRRTRA